MKNKLEALADAISYINLAHEPESPAAQNRNPGMLKAFSLNHIRDAGGHRVFNSVLDGYQALLYDLRIKISGKSHARLPENATIMDLLHVYGHSIETARSVAKRVRKALNEPITADTPLSFFREDK